MQPMDLSHTSNQNDESQANTKNYHINDAMMQYLVADARPDDGIPKYLPAPGKELPFVSIQSLDEHPFACKDNLAYALTSDFNFKTEVLEALIERRYLNIDEIMAAPREIGDVIISHRQIYLTFGLVVKRHIDNKILKNDVTKHLKNSRDF